MKWLFILLCCPLTVFTQTIHFDDEKILYEGSVSLPGFSANEVAARFKSVVAASMDGGTVSSRFDNGKNTVVAEGAIPLTTPFHIIRKVHFTIHLAAKEAGYTYRIDSVAVTERRRGSKPKTKSAKELLEGMEATGTAGTANERLLNEIDLRFQKVLVLLETGIRGLKK